MDFSESFGGRGLLRIFWGVLMGASILGAFLFGTFEDFLVLVLFWVFFLSIWRRDLLSGLFVGRGARKAKMAKNEKKRKKMKKKGLRIFLFFLF